MSLSNEQQYAFDRFIKGENLVITGPGGTGKSKLIQNFVNYCNSINRKIQVTALTGCAALLLGGDAKTIHSWSGIKLCRGNNSDIISQAQRSKYVKKNWTSTKTLIIDEASMMSMKMFNVLDQIGKEIRMNNRPFGGIQIVLACDFYQLPPVENPNDSESGQFCFESKNWYNIFPLENHIVLTKIFRQTDLEYIKILNEVRTGELSEESIQTLNTYLKRTYDEKEHNGIALTRLFPTRNRVDALNEKMFNELEDSSKKYKCLVTTDHSNYCDSGRAIETEKLKVCQKLSLREIENEVQQLTNNSPCVSELNLKVGAAVLCNANIDMDKGICNGSQGVIVDFVGEQKIPRVKFLNGIIMLMSRHNWQSEQYPTISINQYPLQLAWALTIHKIQGTTLDIAQIDIGRDIFAYGQSYVALSRLKSLKGLYLSCFMADRVKANPKVIEFYKNIPPIKISSPMSNNDSIFKSFELQEETIDEPCPDKNIKVIRI